jgi:copper homeostasis protein
LEVERMAADIAACRDLGVDGVVFGCLNADGTFDVEKNRYLIECSKGMSVTCHRAFDRAANPEVALETLIDLGFDRILTSGQQPKAIQGADLLAQLNRQAAGRIILMAGSGVTEQNIRELQEITGLHEFHFSGREPQPSAMQYINPNLYIGRPGANEATLDYTTARRVTETIAQLLD